MPSAAPRRAPRPGRAAGRAGKRRRRAFEIGRGEIEIGADQPPRLDLPPDAEIAVGIDRAGGAGGGDSAGEVELGEGDRRLDDRERAVAEAVRNICSCMPTRPGIAVRPRPSIRETPSGSATDPSGPIAAMRPWSMRMVWSAPGAAPVPSMTRTCSIAVSGPRSRMRRAAKATGRRRVAPPSGRPERQAGSVPSRSPSHQLQPPRQPAQRQPVVAGQAVAQGQPGRAAQKAAQAAKRAGPWSSCSASAISASRRGRGRAPGRACGRTG